MFYFHTMKKLLSLSLALITGLSMAFWQPAMAQDDLENYSRLYNEFLERFGDEPESEPEPESDVQEADEPSVSDDEDEKIPAPEPQEAVSPASEQISLIGQVFRSEGSYFILLEGDGTKRVYGHALADDIVRSVVHPRVQLLGQPAYFNGVEVGISVEKIIVLEPREETKEPAEEPEEPVKEEKKPVKAPEAEKPSLDEKSYFGEIVILEGGTPHLVTTVDGKKRYYRLLNKVDWLIAFQNAYKGDVEVRGVLYDNEFLRYSEILR